MANVLGFFKKIMPFLTVGLSVAGPAGSLAASVLGKVLNVSTPTVDSVQKALSNLTLTPELQVQLAEAENQYKAQMQAMGYQHEEELEQIAAGDRASARQMQVQTKSWVTPTLAMLITIGFFGLLAAMIRRTIPASSEELLDGMVGSLGTAWIMVVTYYFGSSAAHDSLTKQIANGNGNTSK